MTSQLVYSGEEKRDYQLKILVIGELATGKTAVVQRYVRNYFSPYYKTTIGVDFALKILQIDENTVARVQLWDIGGQERFTNMTRVYYKDAVGCILVFDVNRSSTLDAVLKWKADLDSKIRLNDGDTLPCLLLANKCDLPRDGLVNYPDKMDAFCREKGFFKWFETSAKENINIQTSIRCLIDEILTHTDRIKPISRNIIKLTDPVTNDDENNRSRRKCCSE